MLKGINSISPKEIAGMARTRAGSRQEANEILKAMIHEAYGDGEVRFFSIVSSTLRSLQFQFGKTAFKIVGSHVAIIETRVGEHITLVPVIFDVDLALQSIAADLLNEDSARRRRVLLESYEFMITGISPELFSKEHYEIHRAIREKLHSYQL